MNASCVQAAPYEANLYTATRRLKKECCVCHQRITQGERYYSIRYRIGVDAHPHAVHVQELKQFAIKNKEGWEYPFKEEK
jgi:Fe-S-cluster-containing dehydrogenase component